MKVRKDIVSGIRPEDVLTTKQKFTVRLYEEDTINVETRKSKKGGEFEQYLIYLTDNDGEDRTAQYLFERDLSPLAKAWGEDSTEWAGNIVEVGAETEEKDGQTYTRLVLKPLKEQVKLSEDATTAEATSHKEQV